MLPLLADTALIADPLVNVTATPAPVPTPYIDPAVLEAMNRKPDALDIGMRINPFLDWAPFLGIPLWVWITAFFFLLLIMVNAYWLFRMKKLAPVSGYVDAMKKALQEDVQVWVIGKTRKLTIECLRYMDSLISYYDPVRISRWHHNTPMSVMHIGSVPAMLVSDDFDQTRDMVSEIALTYNCEWFNANQEALSEYFKQIGQPDTAVRPITRYRDYDDFGRAALETINPDGLKIPAYSIYDPVKFRKYFPKGCSAGFMGGEFLRDSRKLKLRIREPTFWEKIIPLGFIAGIGLVAILAAWMVPLGK